MGPGDAVSAKPRKVLVVEDDDNIATALEYVISREGMACDRIASGGIALAHIRATRPDLVLLDIMLPEMSGYEICAGIRTDPVLTRTRVLMMTARGSAQEQRRAIEQGADGFIAKPFDLGTLRGEVWRLLSP